MKEKNILVKIFETVDKAAFWVSKLCMFCCAVMLIGVTLIICAGVLNRLIFHMPWLFVEDWSGLILIPLSYMAFGYTLRYNRHLKMDLITRLFSVKTQNFLAIFTAIFSLFCLVYMIGFAKDWFVYCLETHAVSSGPMQTPLALFTFTILLGMIIMTVDMVLFIINRLCVLVYKNGLLNFFDQIEESKSN